AQPAALGRGAGGPAEPRHAAARLADDAELRGAGERCPDQGRAPLQDGADLAVHGPDRREAGGRESGGPGMRTWACGPRAGLAGAVALAQERVGPVKGGALVATGQLVRPAGESLAFPGRPVDLALSPDGSVLYAKDNRGLVVIDAKAWKLTQELPFPEGKG